MRRERGSGRTISGVCWGSLATWKQRNQEAPRASCPRFPPHEITLFFWSLCGVWGVFYINIIYLMGGGKRLRALALVKHHFDGDFGLQSEFELAISRD